MDLISELPSSFRFQPIRITWVDSRLEQHGSTTLEARRLVVDWHTGTQPVSPRGLVDTFVKCPLMELTIAADVTESRRQMQGTFEKDQEWGPPRA